MFISLKTFTGIAPKIDPKRLPDNSAQTAINCDLRNGSLRGLAQTTFVWTPTKAGTKRTIHRFGQNVTDETLYWFHWIDDVDVVKAQIAGDTEERTYFTGDSTYGHPRVTKGSIALTGGGTNYPIGSYRLGVPAPVSAPTNGGVGGTGSGTTETRVYVYTHVTGDGEEGQPSGVLSVDAQDGQSVTLNGLVAGPVGYNITAKRIYRTVTGFGSGTDYQFVDEINDNVTSYVDTKLAEELGETMTSLDYEMPPVTLKCLRNMPNGMVAGIDGNDVLFCEPYRPFAWPTKYRQALDFPGVALGVYGETLVVGTKGNPYVLYGSDPNGIIVKKLELAQACASKRSMVEMGWGVMFASPDGLVTAGQSGADLVTDKIISRDYWQSINPSSIEAYLYNGKYIGFFDNGVKQGFVFDPVDSQQPFALLTSHATAGYLDLVRDSLYLQIGNDIVQWEDNASLFSYTWKSKVFEMPRPVNFAFGVVQAGSYPVTLKVYADGVLKHTRAVADAKPFRLPSGFKGTDWEVQLEGTSKVTAVHLAQTKEELQAL